jgi:hypothetical protein
MVKCQFEGEPECKKRALYNYENESKPKYCGLHKRLNMCDLKNTKVCAYDGEGGCKKRPNFNIPGEKNGKYCVTHREPHMIDNRKLLCEYNDEYKCQTEASCNYRGIKKPILCSLHAKPEMINLYRIECEHTDDDNNKCTKPAYYNFTGLRPKYCKLHMSSSMFDVVNDTCKFVGDEICRKRPTFNFEGETKAIYCKQHMLPLMRDVKNKTCHHIDNGIRCNKIPRYNIKGKSNAIYCRAHKDQNMENIRGKRCSYDGDDPCNKHATYSYKENREKMYCSIHKLPNMQAVIYNFCKHDGCNNRAAYNINGETKGIYCKLHKKSSMNYVGGKRCKYDGTPKCYTRASYNYEGQYGGIYCRRHMKSGMNDVMNNICSYTNCGVQAKYGYPNKKPTRCSQHLDKGMLANPTKRCITLSCKELALYGTTRQVHCDNHKEAHEHNFVEQKCSSCGLLEILGPDNKCQYCNPDNIKKVQLEKQTQVKIYFDENNFEYDQTDKIIDHGTCGLERPDFLFDCGTHYVVVEVDEDQHMSRSCECEQTRMINISQSLGLPTWFIRYNPDNYVPYGKSKKEGGEKRDIRLNTLGEHLTICMNTNPTTNNAFLQVIHLFFDNYNPEYNDPQILLQLQKKIPTKKRNQKSKNKTK